MGYPDGIISEYDLNILKTRLNAALAVLNQIKAWADEVETTDDYDQFADDVLVLVQGWE